MLLCMYRRTYRGSTAITSPEVHVVQQQSRHVGVTALQTLQKVVIVVLLRVGQMFNAALQPSDQPSAATGLSLLLILVPSSLQVIRSVRIKKIICTARSKGSMLCRRYL